MVSESSIGVIQHVELHTSNVQAAITFYNTLFDWSFDQVSDHYWIYAPDDLSICRFGLLAVTEVTVAKMATISVTVTDLEAALAQALTLGATVIDEKTRVADYGYYANIADLDGNPIGLFERDAVD